MGFHWKPVLAFFRAPVESRCHTGIEDATGWSARPGYCSQRPPKWVARKVSILA